MTVITDIINQRVAYSGAVNEGHVKRDKVAATDATRPGVNVIQPDANATNRIVDVEIAEALYQLADKKPSEVTRRIASSGYDPNARNAFEVFSELNRMGVAAENIISAAQARTKFHEMIMRRLLQLEQA